MDTHKEFIDQIDEPGKRDRIKMILDHIKEKYPHLKEEIKWNQPMFSDHGTFIIGFSISKGHISLSPEAHTLDIFDKEIRESGYERTKMTMKIKWKEKVDLDLIDMMIQYNIEDKKDMTRFWR
ncbi:iron chaperone [Gudongella sp. SC589]|uniref:iron chaperone n=1 Tax=Gudongella sp. SC589 TaxID=3385990 RepID=UPI003904DC8F